MHVCSYAAGTRLGDFVRSRLLTERELDPITAVSSSHRNLAAGTYCLGTATV